MRLEGRQIPFRPLGRCGLCVQNRQNVMPRSNPELSILMPIGAKLCRWAFQVPLAQKFVIRCMAGWKGSGSFPSKLVGKTTTSPNRDVNSTCWARDRFCPLMTIIPWARTASRMSSTLVEFNAVTSPTSIMAPNRSAPPQRLHASHPDGAVVVDVSGVGPPQRMAPIHSKLAPVFHSQSWRRV